MCVVERDERTLETRPTEKRHRSRVQLLRILPCNQNEHRSRLIKVDRLEQIIGKFAAPVPDETCEAMQGLVREGAEIVEATGDPAAKDAALIAAAQRVEHYEIAAYGTARTLARQLDYGDAQRLLDETLDEEGEADKLLTKLATGGLIGSGINQAAEK